MNRVFTYYISFHVCALVGLFTPKTYKKKNTYINTFLKADFAVSFEVRMKFTFYNTCRIYRAYKTRI